MRHAGPVIVPAVIACRAMFRGREDVYARRYVSAKSGKCGYSPACTVEWTRGVCDKKCVSCAVCPNRRLLPLDDETIRMHLVGTMPASAISRWGNTSRWWMKLR